MVQVVADVVKFSTEDIHALAKAQLLNALEKLYGKNEAKWLQVLREKRNVLSELHRGVADEVMAELEKEVEPK